MHTSPRTSGRLLPRKKLAILHKINWIHRLHQYRSALSASEREKQLVFLTFRSPRYSPSFLSLVFSLRSSAISLYDPAHLAENYVAPYLAQTIMAATSKGLHWKDPNFQAHYNKLLPLIWLHFIN